MTRLVRRSRWRDEHLPREHGFWVMLGLSTAGGIGIAPTTQSMLASAILVVAAVWGAMRLKRLVRRSLPLQALSVVVLALLATPIAVFGGARLEQGLAVSVPLAFLFLSCSLCVHEILYRAKRRVPHATWSGRGAILLALSGVAVSATMFSWEAAAAMAAGTLLIALLRLVRPSAKQLKRVGLSVAGVQTLAVALLIL